MKQVLVLSVVYGTIHFSHIIKYFVAGAETLQSENQTMSKR